MAMGFSALAAGQLHAASPKEVDDAVDKAVKYLLSQQQANGSWETGTRPRTVPKGYSPEMRWGGETAICTYALLAAGENPTSPAMKKAIDWLEAEDLHGTYAVGLRSQMYPFIPAAARTKVYDAARDRDKDFVLYSRIQRGRNKGFYSYSYGGDGPQSGLKFKEVDKKGPLEGSGFDRSNSQYGVLGAWALDQAQAEIPNQYWVDEDEAWKKSQLNDGGWNYSNEADGDDSASTVTMTSAGIATLFITQDYVMRSNPHQFDTCHGGVTNTNIEKGLAWMDKHINRALQGSGERFYYGLYGIERIGVASGRKYFGTIDWYKGGSDSLVKHQGANGSYGQLHDTCFGLLFLVRGRAPVMMNKLIYQTATAKLPDPWNERPRDTANLARWMGHHSLEAFLNWQVVNLKVSVDELHDAPILYVSGSEDLALSNQDIDKLRAFVEQGGMILGNADCNSKTFAASFEKMGNKMFPKYEFRPLPNSHPIYSEQYLASRWKRKPEVRGMTNGIRELMILLPNGDPGRAWQNDATETQKESFQLAGNIFLYATGKENLESKGVTYIVNPDGPGGKEVKVARLDVGENWNPEPGGWRRISAILHNDHHIDFTPQPVKLGSGLLAGYKIAHLTGTTKVTLHDDQRKEIKDFVAAGGTLIIDAAGGSTDFTDSIEPELTAMFGPAAETAMATPLPGDHPAFGDFKKNVERVYRSYAKHLLGSGLRDPRVRGIAATPGGRIGVFYSREDISGGMVGEPMDGILGYDPKAATELMTNILMYAERGGKAPATGPATTPPPGGAAKKPTVAAKPAAK